MKKLTKLVLIFPIALFCSALTLGCSGGGENVVIEQPETPEMSEEDYEAESYGSVDDESQN